MSDLKEKVAELNDFEENMSFENYKDGVIAYSLKKGFEYFDKNREDQKETFFELKHMQRAVRYAFNSEFDSFIGNASLKEKVEFVTNRAEEFGLHLDTDGHILEAKAPEMEKEKNNYIKGAKDRYECIDDPNMSTEEYLAEKILKYAKGKIEIDIDSKFFDIEDFFIFAHIDAFKKIVDDNSDKNLEYFEKKDQIILELVKDEIKEFGIGDLTGHVISEKLSNAGYKNEEALGYSDKAFFLLDTEFPDFKSKETFYRNQLLEEDKKVVSNEQEIER